MIRAYATIRVTTPGSPIRVTYAEPDPNKYFHVHGVMFEVLPTNVGVIYIGDQTLNQAALTGIFAALAVPTKNSLPYFQAANTLAPGAIQLRDFYIDAAMAGDGVFVTYLET